MGLYNDRRILRKLVFRKIHNSIKHQAFQAVIIKGVLMVFVFGFRNEVFRSSPVERFVSSKAAVSLKPH